MYYVDRCIYTDSVALQVVGIAGIDGFEALLRAVLFPRRSTLAGFNSLEQPEGMLVPSLGGRPVRVPHAQPAR